MGSSRKYGFTIVELLVVIVVIGILATITITSYNGISYRAVAASLKTDLSNAAKQLKMYQVDNGVYPNSISDCPNPSSGNICLKASNGNSFSNYSANNTPNPQLFTLTAINKGVIYIVTNNSDPVALEPAPLDPVADWMATLQGDHYGNYYDLVSKTYANVTRATTKTVYDPTTKKIHDVPAGYLAIRPRSDGKGGNEAVIEETRTNYILTSYFNSDADSDGVSDNWTAVNSNSTSIFSRNTTDSVYGTVQKMSMYHINGGAIGYPNLRAATTASGTFLNGEKAAASIWYRNLKYSGVNPVQLNLRGYDASLANTYDQVAVNLVAGDSNWRLATVSTTFTNANQSRASMRIQQTQVNDGDYFEVEVAAAQLEKGAYATSYIPTTATTVTRNGDVVKIPTTNLNASSGSAFTVASNTWSQARLKMLFSIYPSSGTANMLGLYSNMSTLFTNEASGSDGAIRYASAPTTGLSDGVYATPATTWNGTTVKTYRQGVTTGTVTLTSPLSSIGLNASIGCYRGNTMSNNFNNAIQRVVLYRTSLSDSDVNLVIDSIKDGL